MPEPYVLYLVTAVVVLGLVAWVAFVLKTAKEPWARKDLAPAAPAPAVENAVEPEVTEKEQQATPDGES